MVLDSRCVPDQLECGSCARTMTFKRCRTTAGIALVIRLLGTIAGVVSVDLNESVNRVTVGLLASTAAISRAAVLDRIQRFGIPAAAVSFELTQSFEPAAARAPSLRARRRQSATSLLSQSSGAPDTLGGGLAFDDVGVSKCTVGVVADTGATQIFVSASHCTLTAFHFDGDTVATLFGTRFGVERADKAITTRYSESATFTIFAGPPYARVGVIARPNTRDSVGLGGARDTSINSSKPWLFITSTSPSSNIVMGEVIDKIGAYAGWTYGRVSGTCTDYSS